MKPSEIVIPSFEVAPGKMAGLTYWVSDGPVHIPKFEAAWADSGLGNDILPEIPTPKDSLKRALTSLRSEQELVRPGKKSYFVVDEEIDSATGVETWDANVKLKIEIDALNMLRFEPQDYPSRQRVIDAYNKNMESWSAIEFSAWLKKLVTQECGAVLLHPNGILYFVLPENMERWQKLRAAVTSGCNWLIHVIPCVHGNTDTVQAVLAAVNDEAERAIKEIKKAFEKNAGDRSIDSRLSDIQEARNRLENYRTILGKLLDPVEEKLVDLRAEICRSNKIITHRKKQDGK